MSGLAGHNHSHTAPATESGAAVVNWPNAVTALRLCAVPAAVAFTLRHDLGGALAVFALAGLSDALDGWLARRLGGSPLGAFIDPLADKALLVGMFVSLAVIGALPVWLAALAITRDVLIVFGLFVWWRRGIPVRMRPLAISKLNTALQLVLVAAALLVRGFVPGGEPALDVLVAVVAASTVASGAAYVRVAAG